MPLGASSFVCNASSNRSLAPSLMCPALLFQVVVSVSVVNNKLFLGNLPRELGKEELEAMLRQEVQGMFYFLWIPHGLRAQPRLG